MSLDMGVVGQRNIDYYRSALEESEINDMMNALEADLRAQYPEKDGSIIEYGIKTEKDAFYSDFVKGQEVSQLEKHIENVARSFDTGLAGREHQNETDYINETEWPQKILYAEFPGLGEFTPFDLGGNFNQKFVDTEGRSMLSIPKEENRHELCPFNFNDSREVLMYQITLKRNFDNLSDRGIPTPETDIVISSYGDEKHPFLLMDYRDDMFDGDEYVDRNGKEHYLENVPLNISKNELKDIIDKMVSNAELVSCHPYDQLTVENIGVKPETEEALLWDPGEFSRDMSFVEDFPYEKIEDFWIQEGIKDKADRLI